VADVFLSYARSSASEAKRIASALREQGFTVWFDDELPAHRAYADVIASELDAAKAVLVLWSKEAARSQWVCSEANRAREKNRLVQVRLDEVRLPMPFDQIQCAQLDGSIAIPDEVSWRSVISAIEALVRDIGMIEPSPVAAAEKRQSVPSIAVHKFRELGSAPTDYLGEGLSEEIVTILARMPGIRVTTARETGVGSSERSDSCKHHTAYLEGSVRRSGERARITVRLVDAASGFARWSEAFDRTLSDVFAVQDEIACAVAAALGVTLLDRDAYSIGFAASSDAKANDLALKARHLARQELEVERRTAADLFKQAIARDPFFALAHAGLADVLVQIARWHLLDWQDAARDAIAEAIRAVELAPNLADAHVAMGAALSLTHEPQALNAFSRALELNPHDPNIHYRMARFLVLTGDKVGAIRHYERAYELAPDDYRYVVYALQEYQALGDKDGERRCLLRSAAAIERHLAINPSDVRALGHGAGVLALLGKAQYAEQMMERALALRPDDYGNLATLACAAMLNNNADQALDLLERALATGQGDREWLIRDNDLAPLHGHPRFEALLERMQN